MKAVTAETMQELDRRTIAEHGLPGIVLMEQAGANVAALIRERFGSDAAPSALILAGKGNNGGDGLVVARLLSIAGWRVEVLLYAEIVGLTGDAKANYDRLPAAVIVLAGAEVKLADLAGLCRQAEVVVDALFGTGLKSGINGSLAEVVGVVNSSGQPVVAVDIPSGVDASTGRVPTVAIKADLTVTFGTAKLGQILYPGAEQTGELVVTDIGIPAELLAAAPGVLFVNEAEAAGMVRPRRKAAHKGDNGHLVLVAGSTGKSGAAAMAANSAVRSGAGLVTLAAPEPVHAILEIKTTEAMTVPLPACPSGGVDLAAVGQILALSAGKTVMAIGPGIGAADETAAAVRSLLPKVTLPLVLDADGLNALAAESRLLRGAAAPFTILTPHPGEMARLTGRTVGEIEGDRLAVAAAFAADHNAYLVLKGARTVIAAPDGRLAVNGSGNPGMASGGTGDVLTGVIAALVAQGYEPFAACCLGVFVHGLAADMVAEEKGEIGLNATDIQEMLPYAFKRIAGLQPIGG